ncbi:hypothetical protein QBC35DRAFT_450214 [Podospora australis]|uniref:Phosphatidylcholine-sterol O-acyltransferase n=1 Tax=Podospora australis TaxID=1536484 RepID=A0AAN6WWB0_9PEZI|nr:hypothetical protein QBC35DRAFT_450214 [Podospora australis]
MTTTTFSTTSVDMSGIVLPRIATTDLHLPPAQNEDDLPSPPSDGVEGSDEDFDDQEDAQSLMQPVMSPLVSFLTSPKLQTADRIAAMERLPGGIFVVLDENDRALAESGPASSLDSSFDGAGSLDGVSSSKPQRNMSEPIASTSQQKSQDDTGIARLPTPWQAGPKQFQITEPGRFRASMGIAMKSQSRHKRASSISENALKRISKALPSISIPSSLMPHISTPGFFSSSSSTSSPQKDSRPSPPPKTPQTPYLQPPPSAGPRSLRRTTSDDSLLYSTLSRVSSLGDDARFVNVREQINVRFKAIMDSFDGPSFKMPQMPNLLNNINTPLKKSASDPMTSSYRSAAMSSALQQPQKDPLDSVLESLTGDIVIMGGYRGSILRSAKAPHRRLWVPVKVQLGVRKVNLEVGLEPEDEENMDKSIFADGMLKNIGPVDISRRLFKRIRECENARTGKLRVHDYGYDWRLSPHLLSKKLVDFLEKLPSNHPSTPQKDRGVLVISHSLGGLITRHAVNQRPELFSGVLYVGVPQRCISVLGPLRNGDAVLLNEKILSAHVNFTLRTSFVFFPEDGFCFIDKNTGEELKVDFYNVDDWIKYRWCPSVSEPALPPIVKPSGTFSSLLSLSDSLPSLPLRSRSNTQTKRASIAQEMVNSLTKDRTLAPQMNSSSATAPLGASSSNSSSEGNSPAHSKRNSGSATVADATRARNLEYLTRTLAQTKKFRAELAHNPSHQEGNRYPPLGLMYAKDIPTTYGCRVNGRDGIACTDAYDDLVFRSGDGVVLAKEAMLPEGYEIVRGGRIVTDRGHITMLGDLNAVGRALEAVVRGRKKGIGMGDNGVPGCSLCDVKKGK